MKSQDQNSIEDVLGRHSVKMPRLFKYLFLATFSVSMGLFVITNGQLLNPPWLAVPIVSIAGLTLGFSVYGIVAFLSDIRHSKSEDELINRVTAKFKDARDLIQNKPLDDENKTD